MGDKESRRCGIYPYLLLPLTPYLLRALCVLCGLIQFFCAVYFMRKMVTELAGKV